MLAALLGVGCFGSVQAQSDAQVMEYRVKAALLYKFAHYVEWPPQSFANAGAPLVIGVLGAEALAEELSAVVASRNIGNRPVVTRKLKQGDTLAGLHMLFIGRDSARIAGTLAAATAEGTLTVTESDGAFALGSAINFVVVDDKVRFDVALGPAEAGNLKISARLLSVARKVVTSAS